MRLDVDDHETQAHLARYIERLELPDDRLSVTISRRTFEGWLGRRVGGGIGGAYVYFESRDEHAILINLPRIDRSQARAVEIVVAEELIHMRDRLNGDRRRHAKHGHDRIAHRVADLTGASLDEIRSCLVPRAQRPFRYLYACPTCGVRVPRKVRGTWSCGQCSPGFRRRHQLRLIAVLERASVNAVSDELFGQ